MALNCLPLRTVAGTRVARRKKAIAGHNEKLCLGKIFLRTGIGKIGVWKTAALYFSQFLHLLSITGFG
jgi:hypothetical protein